MSSSRHARARQRAQAGLMTSLWDSFGAEWLGHRHGTTPDRGFNARTKEARAAGSATRPSATPVVDLYVDPVCPYTWLVARWLREVEQRRDLDLRFHVMSLRLLNEGRALFPRYREVIDASAGPSRVATAVVERHGTEALRAWHTAFGERIFDEWRFPDSDELRAASAHALAVAGLPTSLVHAADTTEYDAALRRSHDEGVLPVGADCGTPVIHLDGAAYFGPVLNAVPTGDDALRLFDGIRLLTRCDDFYELKRTRSAPPDLCPIPTDKEEGRP